MDDWDKYLAATGQSMLVIAPEPGTPDVLEISTDGVVSETPAHTQDTMNEVARNINRANVVNSAISDTITTITPSAVTGSTTSSSFTTCVASSVTGIASSVTVPACVPSTVTSSAISGPVSASSGSTSTVIGTITLDFSVPNTPTENTLHSSTGKTMTTNRATTVPVCTNTSTSASTSTATSSITDQAIDEDLAAAVGISLEPMCNQTRQGAKSTANTTSLNIPTNKNSKKLPPLDIPPGIMSFFYLRYAHYSGAQIIRTKK